MNTRLARFNRVTDLYITMKESCATVPLTLYFVLKDQGLKLGNANITIMGPQAFYFVLNLTSLKWK